jgi:hypothetical protein
MLRAAALSLLMLFTVVTMLPLTTSLAYNNEASAASSHKERFRRHSRAWWRRYRARQRRRRASIARQRALKALRMQNAIAANSGQQLTADLGGVYNHPRGQWSITMPEGWSDRPAIDGNEMKFRINADGQTTGQATLSVVAMANSSAEIGTSKRNQNRSLGGVSVTTLRRTVIDRMIKEGGWVLNDFYREIAGRRVFVVQAHTPGSSDGRIQSQSQTYYFTEVDGRIYSLATAVPVGTSERVAAGSEQIVASIRLNNRATPTAASLR